MIISRNLEPLEHNSGPAAPVLSDKSIIRRIKEMEQREEKGFEEKRSEENEEPVRKRQRRNVCSFFSFSLFALASLYLLSLSLCLPLSRTFFR
jgi:hypothetical protein